MKREEDGDDDGDDGEGGSTIFEERWKDDEGRGRGKRRGLKTISLAPYLTPTCIREWEYPLLSRWEKETAGDEPP